MKTTKTKLPMYRQGDVLIRRVDTIPAAAKDVTPEGRVVLAHGEVTGHAHAIAEKFGARELSFADAEDVVRRFLAPLRRSPVRHEEHATIPLTADGHEIVQQVEYTPEAIRNVQD